MYENNLAEERAKARHIANRQAEPVALYTTADDIEPKFICMNVARNVGDGCDVIEIVYPVEEWK